MSTDTLELPVRPVQVAPPALLPASVVPVLTKHTRHARRVTASRGYRIANAVLWGVFGAIVPPMVAILGGPFIYEVGI